MKILLFFFYLIHYISCIQFSSDSEEEIYLMIRRLNNRTKEIIKKRKETEESPIVEIEVFPLNGQTNSNWTVSWSATPTNIADNSWIGVYPYAQVSTYKNLISYFNIVNHTRIGTDFLQIPSPGIYVIKYIQDNNKQTIAYKGPLVVNNKGSSIVISNGNIEIGGKLTISWDVENINSETTICLNVIGKYDECIWTQNINSETGVFKVQMPKYAGYFVFRIIKKVKTWKYYMEETCLAVSSIIKVSSNKHFLKSQDNSVVASTIYTDWNVEDLDNSDWIGLFNIESSNVFLRSEKPIDSIKVNKKSGKFEVFLPPNSQAVDYIFIYFSNHIPIAVSDFINVQQPKVKCPENNTTMSNIKHLVIICTENHSFDNYFGRYCTGENNPNCNHGRSCCEKAPEEVQGFKPYLLNDTQNMLYDPDHNQDCELCEINGGKMDGFIKGCYCSNPMTYAIANFNETLAILHEYASNYALADRFFQPSAGASSQNDMYFARASYVFRDNTKASTGSVGTNCWYLVHFLLDEFTALYDPNISGLLANCNFILRTYAEGYKNASLDFKNNKCYPYGYDAADIPFNYYVGIRDKKEYITDYDDFIVDINNGTLPDVSFIKPLGINTAHPGMANITDEINFIKKSVDAVLNSKYVEDTLILWIPDESGGYYDHIPPPETNPVDNIPYGPRIPVLAIGKFAKKNYISHVTMEHSSVVKFIEWNWLSARTGQLNTRDRNVNNIGDLIDPVAAGIKVPS